MLHYSFWFHWNCKVSRGCYFMSHPWLLSPVLQAYLCKIAISMLLDICYVIWYVLNISWVVDMWNYIISKLFIKREQGDGLLVDCYQSVLCRYVCCNGIVMQLGWCVSTFCVVVFWRLCVFYHTCKSIMSEWKIRGGKMWGLKKFLARTLGSRKEVFCY